MPDARWAGVREAPEGYPVDELCAELARAFADALIGEAPPGLSLGAHHAMNAELARTAWLASLTRAPEPPAALFGDTRLAALREVRWLSLLGVKEPVSLAELEARFPEGAIPWVPRSTATLLNLRGWHPLFAGENEVGALARLLDRELVCATDELTRRRQGLTRVFALDRHRRQPLSRSERPLGRAAPHALGARLHRGQGRAGGASDGRRVPSTR